MELFCQLKETEVLIKDLCLLDTCPRKPKMTKLLLCWVICLSLNQEQIFTSNGFVIVLCLDGTDLSPSLPVWVTGEEAEGDHREELYTLHVLNLFAEGQRRVEGMERKCTPRPKWNTRWQEVGRRPLKLTPGLGAAMAPAIDPARDGREGSQVPPEGLQTMQIYYGWGGEWSRPHCSQSYHCSDSQNQLAAS